MRERRAERLRAPTPPAARDEFTRSRTLSSLEVVAAAVSKTGVTVRAEATPRARAVLLHRRKAFGGRAGKPAV
jgi:hypothetical protein